MEVKSNFRWCYLYMFLLLAVNNGMYCQTNSIIEAYFTPGNKILDYQKLTTSSLEEFSNSLDRLIKDGQKALVNVSRENRTFGNTIHVYDKIADDITKGVLLLNLLSMSHEDEAIRNKSIEILQKLAVTGNEFNNDPAVFTAIKDYSNTPEAGRLNSSKNSMLKIVLKNFEDGSERLSKQQQDSLQTVDDELYKLQLQFQKNIRDDVHDTLLISNNEFVNISLEKIAGIKKTDNGYLMPINDANYRFLIGSTLSDAVKTRIFGSFSAKGEKENPLLMQKILQLRKQRAKLMGFNSFAAYRLNDKILNEPRKVDSLLQGLIYKLHPLALHEYKTLIEIKQNKTSKTPQEIFPWEIEQLTSLLQDKQNVNSLISFKQYFNENTITRGLFNLAYKLFQLEFKEIETKGWHKDVRLFSVSRKGKFIGRIYLDLFARPGKYQQFQAMPIQLSRNCGSYIQMSAVAILLNFQSEKNGAYFLTDYSDLETYFHEFGHSIHYLLGKTEYSSQSVSMVASELTESVSKFFQLFCRDYYLMKQIFKNVNSKESLQKDMYTKVLNANSINRNMRRLNTVFNAYFDFFLHNSYNPFSSQSVSQVYDSLNTKIDVWPTVKESHNESSFIHFVNMPCDYYTYILTDEIAAKWFNKFYDGKIMRWDLGMKLEKTILRNGSSIPEKTMIENFNKK